MSKTHSVLSWKFALLLVAAIFLFTLAAPAHAQDQPECSHATDTLASGNELYVLLTCQSGRAIHVAAGAHLFAAGYVRGVADTLAASGRIRSGGEITNVQLRDIVEKWLKEHPELRDRPADECVTYALTEALPPEKATKPK
jgi:hypothetical protein